MSLSSSRLQVLIVGAGPTGLTTALYLAKRGASVRIIEQSTKEHGGIRGTAIHPRTLELLAILGADKDILKIATEPLQMAVYGPDGNTILKTFEWSEAAEDSPTIPFRRTVSISQAQLERVLRHHLKKYGCDIEMGRELIAISQDNDKVTAKIVVSEDGTEEIVECSYLVAADGAKGRCRRLIGISFLGETKEADRLWTANVTVPGFSREYWHRWGVFTAAATFLKPVYPAPLFQMQTLGPSLPKDVPMDLAGTQQLFNSITGRNDLKLEKVEHVSEWKANIRMTDKFSIGRVFLTGDAAHCHSPAGGQGTNTAMQDAINLAWKLALVLDKKVTPALLESYDAERMPVVAEMLSLSSALHARAFSHIPATAFVAPQVPSDPMQRSRNLLQLGVNYRWSNIIFDDREADAATAINPYGSGDTQVRAGDRAPYVGDLKGEQTTDLFELLRSVPSHLVLLFPSESPTAPENLSAIKSYMDAGLVQVIVIVADQASLTRNIEGIQYLVDSQGNAYKAYVTEPNRNTYVTIRPDGIIGAYTFGVNGIKNYCARLGASV